MNALGRPADVAGASIEKRERTITVSTVALRLASRATSDEELAELARLNPHYRLERSASGDVLVSPPAGSESSRKTGLLYAQVELWNASANAGYTFESSAGFRMPDGAVLSPDISWIERTRYDELSRPQKQLFAPLCPDLIIEVKSPSDQLGELRAKLERFRGYGTRIAVLFDPDSGVTLIDASGIRELGRCSDLELEVCPYLPPLALSFSSLYD